MRIVLLTNGTLGDTLQFVNLAKRLRQEGHSVLLAARPDFVSLAKENDIEFHPLGNSYKTFVSDNHGAKIIGLGNIFKIIHYGIKQRISAAGNL